MKLEDSDTRMLEEILNGNPPLNEEKVDISIRHATNNATSNFNSKLVSKQFSERYHLEKERLLALTLV